ncbi:paired box protein 6 homolog [Montipora capricornis]|uniref:paired box protein 6 homolog n=1 Tax=Montipora capricornis TaxID=246305 RepID=UPI0035F1E289
MFISACKIQNPVSDAQPTARNVQLHLNQSVGFYDNGRALSLCHWERVLDLYHDRNSERGIAREVCVSRSYVNNIIKGYNEANTSLRAPNVCRGLQKVDLYASEYTEVQRLVKPSIYASEIRQRLLLDGVLHPTDLPSSSQINKLSRNEHAMTRKKISVIPCESTTTEVTDRQNR